MLSSLSLIFLVGLLLASFCKILKLPRIIGLLVTGILLGPYVFNLLDEKVLMMSSELRKIALIIILIKAGLSLNIADLKNVGISAIMMSFVPASFEILGFFLFAPMILKISRLDALIMGSVLAAVSPAVVVPRMVSLMEKGYGTKSGVPQIIIAGASCDDIFVIVLFTTFLNMARGGSFKATDFINVPISIILGIVLGVISGFFLCHIFETSHKYLNTIRNSTKVIIVLGVSFILVSLEDFLKDYLSISGLIAVMAMALVIQLKSNEFVSSRLSEKFGKLWIAAEILLFVLVGASVDISYTLKAGPGAILIIFIALIFRTIGVIISLSFTKFNLKEKLFCIFSYLPKATVQAAIGSVPISIGLSCGPIVLSVAVVAILVTAPIGAFLMDLSYKRLLEKN